MDPLRVSPPPRKRAAAEVLAHLEGPLAARIRPARRLLDSPVPEELLPTGFASWDELLAGGLRRGTLTEIVGKRSRGRFSLALNLIATVTDPGETAALIDLGDALDPRQAEGAGVDLERLLWLRPRDTREALAAAATVLDGGFPLILVELGLPPVRGGRGNEAGWVRLARSAAERRAALIVSSPYRVSGTAAQLVLRLAPAHRSWLGGGLSPLLLGRLGLRLGLEKARGRRPGEHAPLQLYPDGPRQAACPARPRVVELPRRAACG